MIALLFRIITVAVVISVLYSIIKWFLRPSDFVKCGRCDGKGFWTLQGEKRHATGVKDREDCPDELVI